MTTLYHASRWGGLDLDLIDWDQGLCCAAEVEDAESYTIDSAGGELYRLTCDWTMGELADEAELHAAAEQIGWEEGRFGSHSSIRESGRYPADDSRVQDALRAAGRTVVQYRDQRYDGRGDFDCLRILSRDAVKKMESWEPESETWVLV